MPPLDVELVSEDHNFTACRGNRYGDTIKRKSIRSPKRKYIR